MADGLEHLLAGILINLMNVNSEPPYRNCLSGCCQVERSTITTSHLKS